MRLLPNISLVSRVERRVPGILPGEPWRAATASACRCGPALSGCSEPDCLSCRQCTKPYKKINMNCFRLKISFLWCCLTFLFLSFVILRPEFTAVAVDLKASSISALHSWGLQLSCTRWKFEGHAPNTSGSDRKRKYYLWDDDPDQAEPPELHGSKHCSQDISKSTGNKVSKDVLDGVSYTE